VTVEKNGKLKNLKKIFLKKLIGKSYFLRKSEWTSQLVVRGVEIKLNESRNILNLRKCWKRQENPELHNKILKEFSRTPQAQFPRKKKY
jgi:hypothetical protein